MTNNSKIQYESSSCCWTLTRTAETFRIVDLHANYYTSSSDKLGHKVVFTRAETFLLNRWHLNSWSEIDCTLAQPQDTHSSHN